MIDTFFGIVFLLMGLGIAGMYSLFIWVWLTGSHDEEKANE